MSYTTNQEPNAGAMASRDSQKRTCFAAIVCTFLVATGISAVAGQETPASRSDEERSASGQLVRTADGESVFLTPEDIKASRDAVSSPVTNSLQVITQTALPDEVYTLGLEKKWEMSVWGTSIGRSGLIPVDLDGDGALEIVTGASLSGGFAANSAWHVVRHNPQTNGYEIIFSDVPSPSGVDRIQVFDLAGKKKIFIGLGNGDLQIYDGATLKLDDQLNVASSGLTSILLADANNDGVVELVVSSANSTHLLDVADFSEKVQIPYGAGEVAIGNVDTDPALEIVYSSGAVVELNETLWVEEWDFSTFSTGTYIDLADVDDDGIEEIVSARSWYYIDIYDADTQSPKAQVNTDLNIHDVLMIDVTGDGKEELLYGDAQWGNIYALDAGTLQEIWRIRNPEHGTTRIAVGDTDNDGEDEVMWGGGWTSTGEDFLFIHDIRTLALEFQSVDLVGPFHAVTMGDADDDGTEEIVAISFESNSGYSDGVVHVFDGETFALEWQSDTALFNRFAWTGIHDVEVGDVDGDGENEIVVGTDRLYDGAIYVIDAKTKSVESQFLYDSGSPIYALVLEDFDDDGVVDIIAGGGTEHTGSPGTYAYVVDGVTGAIKWQSVSLSASFSDVYAIDSLFLNSDSAPEIVVSFGNLYIVDGSTKVVTKSLESDYRGFALGDANGDGQTEIWAGTTDGRLFSVDIETFERTEIATICTEAVYSVKLNRASTLEGSIQFSCADSVGIYGIFEDAVIWRGDSIVSTSSYSSDTQVGYANNLGVVDRGDQALLVAGTRYGVVAYQGYGTSNTDIDGDEVLNHLDNCPETPNPGQEDADGDQIGDACNDDIDTDGDEWADRLDNCAMVANGGQQDADSDGVGNACNDADDSDGDEWSDALDNCIGTINADQADRDGDIIGDVCDPYPDNPDNYAARCDEAIVNEAQLGLNLAACEAEPKYIDADLDGEADLTDSCPDTPAGEPVDSDGCSLAEFCEEISGSGYSRMLICVRSDWKNDEPLFGFPRDCRVSGDGAWWRSYRFSCIEN